MKSLKFLERGKSRKAMKVTKVICRKKIAGQGFKFFFVFLLLGYEIISRVF